MLVPLLVNGKSSSFKLAYFRYPWYACKNDSLTCSAREAHISSPRDDLKSDEGAGRGRCRSNGSSESSRVPDCTYKIQTKKNIPTRIMILGCEKLRTLLKRTSDKTRYESKRDLLPTVIGRRSGRSVTGVAGRCRGKAVDMHFTATRPSELRMWRGGKQSPW